MGDVPRDYLDTMMKAIMALEIKITRLVGKGKLSQTKNGFVANLPFGRTS